MGLFSFIANAGKKIFGGGHAEAEAGQPVQQLNEVQTEALRQHVAGLGLNIKDLNVRLDGPGAITLMGEAPTKADYEKAALMAGNVMGITTVNNQMTIAAAPQAAAPEADSETYTIVKGDTLWAIAEKHYGSGTKYPEIVKANQPMIKDADEIYPGQVLRLPKLA
jgi:nucleoid-associated protein YgaU